MMIKKHTNSYSAIFRNSAEIQNSSRGATDDIRNAESSDDYGDDIDGRYPQEEGFGLSFALKETLQMYYVIHRTKLDRFSSHRLGDLVFTRISFR